MKAISIPEKKAEKRSDRIMTIREVSNIIFDFHVLFARISNDTFYGIKTYQ
jgi:hypothetical protein